LPEVLPADDEEVVPVEAQPRRPARPAGPRFGVLTLKLLFCFCGGVVFAGVALCLGGFAILAESSRARPEPQTLTCKQLLEQGCGDNAHVLLTDVKVLAADHLVESRKDNGEWVRTCIPLRPVEVEADPETIRLVLVSTEVPGEQALLRLAGQDRVQGLVYHDTLAAAPATADLFTKRFPNTDPSRCLLLEHRETGSRLWPREIGFLLLGGGVVLLVLGLVATAWWFRTFFVWLVAVTQDP
jgi:hypothetical protein